MIPPGNFARSFARCNDRPGSGWFSPSVRPFAESSVNYCWKFTVTRQGADAVALHPLIALIIIVSAGGRERTKGRVETSFSTSATSHGCFTVDDTIAGIEFFEQDRFCHATNPFRRKERRTGNIVVFQITDRRYVNLFYSSSLYSILTITCLYFWLFIQFSFYFCFQV